MSDFEDLVGEAEQAPIEGWDFGWLDGRAVEDRPTWRYFDRVVERVAGGLGAARGPSRGWVDDRVTP